MLQELERMKHKGLAFERAWRIALERIRWPHDSNSRKEWKAVITATRETWRACYCDEGHPIDVEALVSALHQAADDRPHALVA